MEEVTVIDHQYRNPLDSGAFLIPYLLMGVLFGLPMLYLDSSIGQFMQNSPSIAFRQYFPASQGTVTQRENLSTTDLLRIGLDDGAYPNLHRILLQSAVLLGANLHCTGTVILDCMSYRQLITFQLIAGRMQYLTSCQNEWNTPCQSFRN